MSYVSHRFPIKDASHVGEARRALQALAEQSGFSKTETGNIAIIATEMAGNIVKHGSGGEIIFRELEADRIKGLEVLALDSGKGMTDINRCMEDGYSTAGSPGTGLGAVRRLATLFDIYSRPEKGTAILAQLWTKSHHTTKEHYTVGAVCIPYPGEKVCGDAWAFVQHDNTIKCMVIDGLGHGPYAFEATQPALEVFKKQNQQGPSEMMHSMHGALRSTRGAAAAVAEIEAETNSVKFSGIGNIAGFIVGGAKDRGLASYNGTLGHQLHKVQELALPWPPNALAIMHSDGLGTKWRLDDYPGLKQRHPALIAGVLYRDFTRGRDDVTVLVIKET